MRPKTQGKHLFSNLERKNYDSNELNQISYKQDLSKDIFDLQWHHKTTAAFILNKFLFIIWFKYTQNIYTLSEETFAHICVLYFDAKAILQNP